MTYQANNYEKLIGMKGFSERLLKNHFSLYQGYVKNTNTLYETINKIDREGQATLPEYAELKRRFGWEFNGMRLHELYFENLGGNGQINMEGRFGTKLRQDYNSYEEWEKDFKATAGMRGIGWTVLYQDTVSGKLLNTWINEHDTGHLAGCVPLLVLDVFEHAFMIDYDLKKADYITSFFQNINWQAVESRFKQP